MDIRCLKCVEETCYFRLYVGVCLLEGRWAAADGRQERATGRIDRRGSTFSSAEMAEGCRLANKQSTSERGREAGKGQNK